MKKLTILALCLVTVFLSANAVNTYYVDTSKGTNSSGNSFTNAFNTIAAAETAAANGDNIYIKGNVTITSSLQWNLKAVNYYGGFAGIDGETPAQRPMNDNDGNGIIEPWEFKYPTVFSSSYSAGNAIVLLASTTLDGFTVSNGSSGSAISKTNSNTTSFINPIGGIVQNCVFSGSYLNYNSSDTTSPGGCLIKNLGDFKNCLIEKNTVTITLSPGAGDNNFAPIFEFNFGSVTCTPSLSRCVFRNNMANISSSTTATFTAKYIRGLIVSVYNPNGTAVTQSATISDCLIYNNEIAYTNTASSGGVATLYVASIVGVNGTSTSFGTNIWVNNTIANNKMTNCIKAFFVYPGGAVVNKIYNNVFWNNQNNGAAVSMSSGSTQVTGTIVSNNIMDVGTNGTWGNNVFVNNQINLSTTNTTASTGPQFINPPLNSGSNIIGSFQTTGNANLTAINQADWRLNSTSYLIAKGAATSTTGIGNDKSSNVFASTPAAGAYEAVPVITTTAVSSITGNSAASGETIVWNGGTAITASGVCWSTSQNPTTADSKTTDNISSGSFASNLTGLSSGVTYYVRAYATNTNYTSYGMQQSFTTLSSKPTPTNQPTAFSKGAVTSSSIPLSFTAAVAGSQAPDGYLIKMSTGTIADPVNGTDPSDITTLTGGVANVKTTTSPVSSFTGLTAGTLYHFKIYSYTNYGAQINFNTTSAPSLDVYTGPAPVTGATLTPTITDFSSPTLTANLSWTNPGSFDAVNHTTLVFVKQGSAITVGTPTNAASTYTASTNMVTGSTGTAYQGDASAYCVYNGTGTSVSLTGMATAATYYVLIVTAYNSSNSDGTNSYSSSATASATMYKRGPINYTTNLAKATVTTSSISLSWTSASTGSQAPDGYMVVSKALLSSVPYPVNGTDQSDVTAYTGGVANKKVTPQSATGMSSFTNMTAGTTYYYKIFPYTNSGAQINYKTSGTVPTIAIATLPNAVTNLSFSSSTATAATINWSAASGYNSTNHSTLVFVKATSAVTQGSPVSAPTAYTANTTFGSGTAYDADAAAYCVYNGDGTSVSITGLTSNSTYQVLVYTVVDAANTDLTYSFSALATATGATILDAPTIVSVVPGDQTATVNFTAPGLNSGSDITNYKYSTDGGIHFLTRQTGTTASPIVITTSSIDGTTALVNGTSYNVQIKAVNANGDGTASGSTSGTPAPLTISISSDASLSSYYPSSITDVTVLGGVLTIDETETVKSMTLNPGGKLTVASGKSLTVLGVLTLHSSLSGQATLVDLNPTGGLTVNGATNVEQYLSKSRNWYVSSPVSLATAAVVDPQHTSNLLYWYDETKGAPAGWTPITSNAASLTPGLGYIVHPAADGATLNYTGGNVNTGTTPSFLVNRTSEAPDHAGFNLIGNPYPSYLNAVTVVNSSSNLDKSIWYRTQKNNTSTYYFDTYNTLGKQGTNNSANVAHISGTVAPMQAFWVHVSNGQSSASINFDNSYRTHANADTLNPLKVKNQVAQASLHLQVSNGVNSDETLIYSDPNASNGYDMYDSQKMSNVSASIPELYTLAGTEPLAINGMNTIPYDFEIALGFSTLASGNFSIKASQFSNFTSGTEIILKDNMLNAQQDLTVADYLFTSDATTNNTSRFTLIFHAPSVATGINTQNNDNVWISTRNGQLVVNGIANGATLEVFNALGLKVISRNLSGTNIQENNNLPVGAYLVKLTNEGKSITKKIIID